MDSDTNTRLQKPPSLLPTFWGKFDSDTGQYHALIHHCADVAACVQELLEQPNFERSLAQSTGLKSLTIGQKSRLAAIAFLHDLGKIALGFQCQICFPKPAQSPTNKGHIKPIFSCLFAGAEDSAWLTLPLGAEDFVSWDNCGGNTFQELLAAALAHHGSPVDIGNLGTASEFRNQWQAIEHCDPKIEAKLFGQCLRTWFPEAFESDHQHRLPSSTEFQHAYAGLVSLADWIASDVNFFRFCATVENNYMARSRQKAKETMQAIGLDLHSQRAQFHGVPSPIDLFGFNTLRPLQQMVYDASVEQKTLILEAETGSGKTEAALLRFSKLYEAGEVDSLYFAVPTRAAAVQLHRRVCEFCSRFFAGNHMPQPVLAVPGYMQAGAHSGQRLPGFVVEWDDTPTLRDAATRWTAEHHKRFLAAQIAVGTIDQVMLSAMPVKHAHLRATALSRSLLVIDELHASDHYMQEIIQRVVQQHISFGSHLLMMSATLSASARERWLSGQRKSTTTLEQAICMSYPCLSFYDGQSINSQAIEDTGYHKEIDVSLCSTSEQTISSRIWQAAHAGARVLVIRNTVKGAIALLEHLQADAQCDSDLLFNINGVITLHHSRFAAEDRKRLDEAAEIWLGKNRPGTGGIVVGTQTLEQSLDIDTDLLITDLCPIDVLLQRIGRLHRHNRATRPDGYQQAKAIVISPDKSELSCLLKKSEIGLGPKSKVYPDLPVLQATLNLINRHSVWHIPTMNRELVDGALHCSVREQILAQHGLDWQIADQARDGSANADAQAANMHRLRTDKNFLDREVCFSRDIKLPTRLGEDSLMVSLKQSVLGPFDAPVSNFNIPGWMLKADRTEYEQSPIVTRNEKVISIEFEKEKFYYSQTGLTEAKQDV